jgi:hypothetical protein
MKQFSIAASAAIVVTVAMLFIPLRAQQTMTHEHQHDQTAPQMNGMGMMNHDQMMADMQAADARLQALDEQMKSARGDEKMQAMQDLLDAMVQNQVGMHHQMEMMHEHMMQMPPK